MSNLFQKQLFYCQTNAPFQPEVYSPPESGISRRGQKTQKKTYMDITNFRLNLPRGLFSKNPAYRRPKYILKFTDTSTTMHSRQFCQYMSLRLGGTAFLHGLEKTAVLLTSGAI